MRVAIHKNADASREGIFVQGGLRDLHSGIRPTRENA